MALSLKDPRTDALARQVASLTGESLTEAVRTSLSERLARERLKRGKPAWNEDAIQKIIESYAAAPLLDDRTAEEILGYDENGLPT